MVCVDEGWIVGAAVDCGGEVGLGARRGLCRRSLDWGAAGLWGRDLFCARLNCVGKGWIGAWKKGKF